MAKKFKGKIALDIRDSEPDWDAVPGAEGTRRRAQRAASSPGTTSATPRWTSSAVRSQCPNMARIAERGVKFSNFHTTALCSPTRASLLTGRNATIERHGHHRRVRLRVPRHLDPHPVRERLHLRGARRARLQHLLRRQVAPDAGRGVQPRRVQGPLAARAAASSASTAGSAARRTRTSPTSCTTTTRSSRRDGPRTATTWPTTCADKAVEFIRDAKVIDPDKPFFMYLAPQAGHAPHLVPLEWADRYKGVFDEGYEAIRDRHPRAPDRARPAARGHELSPINPHGEPERTGPDGQPWPLLDTVRPWDSLSDDETAAVHPHGRGVRRLHLLLRRPARPGPRLPRGVRPARQHARSSSCPTTAPAARAARTAASTSGGSSTACPTRPRRTLPHIDELGTPASNNHYNTGWAWALDTPVPVLEALGRRRGRRRRHVHRLLAGADPGLDRDRATSTSTPSTSSRRSTTCSASSRPR